MRYRTAITLAAGLSLACTAGAQTGLRIKVAFPSSFHTQAIPSDTRAVPVLVFHDGKLMDRAILTPNNPAAFFRGLPIGDVEVLAAGFSRRFTPTAVGKGGALIQPAGLAKAEVVMRETTSDPLLDRFKPFLDEIKQHIEREFPLASASPGTSASPGATSTPIPQPSGVEATPTPAAGSSKVAPTVGSLTATPYTPYTTTEGTPVSSGATSLAAGDLLINGVDVGAWAASGANSSTLNAQELAAHINLVSSTSGVRAMAAPSDGIYLYSKGTAINITATAPGTSVSGLSNSNDVPAVAANYYSGFPVLLTAPVAGSSPLSYAIKVVNGARTADYVYNGSQWLLTAPTIVSSPIPLIPLDLTAFSSALQEGAFGAPVLSGGQLQVMWHAPTVVADSAMSLTLSVSNSAGSASSPALNLTVKVPPTAGGSASVTF